METQSAFHPCVEIKQKILADLKYKGYEKCKIDYKLAGGEGENFVSTVFKVTIQAKKYDEDIQINAFLKTCNVFKEYLLDILPFGKLFENERLAYFEIFPIFEILRKNSMVSDSLKFAQCLSFSSSPKNEYLLLKDLSIDGYKTRSRDLKLDETHMKLVLTNLAHFHCMSFVLKKLEPEKYHNLTANLEEELLAMKDELKPTMRVHAKYMTSIIVNAEIRTKMEGYSDLMESSNFFEDLLNANIAKPYNVIGHGDFWNSNIMFSYEHGKPKDVIFIDFQFIRNHSPVLDLMHLFFTSCADDLRTRDDGLEYLLDFYHQSFCDFAAKYNQDGENMFPRQVLYEHLRIFSPLGLLICNFMLPTQCRELGDEEDEFSDPSKSLQMNEGSRKYLDSSYNFVLSMCDKHGMLDFIAIK